MEIASDLSATCFLAAFNRFTSQRNAPSRIYSVNGAQCAGSERDIAELFAGASPHFAKVRKYVDNLGISWLFSPPYGPQLSGIWETAVKHQLQTCLLLRITDLVLFELSTPLYH